MKTKKFPCGCEFPLIDGRIQFDPDVENINLECKATWDLIGSGQTTGLFQIESQLGRTFSKKLKPTNITLLSLLISIIRPGCLESKIDNKSITEHCVLRKNNEEPIDYYHKSLKEILEPTFGLLVYQEQAIAIVSKLGGFTSSESDILRRAIGHKEADTMQTVEKQFLKKCQTIKLTTLEESTEIFNWIKKSQRYSFNKSHGVSYSMNTYLTAYTKAHFPHEFFTSSLYFAKNKPKPFEEIRILVYDARSFDVSVNVPNIKYLNSDFQLIDKKIYFGLLNIKGVGQSVIKNLHKQFKNISTQFNKKIDQLTWVELLVFVFPKINSTSVKAIIDAGILDHLKIDRKKMKYEYEKYNIICSSQKTNDQKWIENNYKPKWKTLTDCLTSLSKAPIGKNGGCFSSKRLTVIQEIIQSLKSPPYSLSDSIVYLSEIEEAVLGLPISCTAVEACDIESANATCMEFKQGARHSLYFIACQIDRKHEIVTKTNKKMCFLTCSDISGSLDSVVIFPEPYAQYRPLLFNRNNIMIVGTQGKDKGSFIVKKVYQL